MLSVEINISHGGVVYVKRFFLIALAVFSFLFVGGLQHHASAERILCHTDIYGKNNEFRKDYYIETDSIYTDTVFNPDDRIFVDVYYSDEKPPRQYFFFHYKGHSVNGGRDVYYDEWKYNYYREKGFPERGHDEYFPVKGNKAANDILYATLEAMKYL